MISVPLSGLLFLNALPYDIGFCVIEISVPLSGLLFLNLDDEGSVALVNTFPSPYRGYYF